MIIERFEQQVKKYPHKLAVKTQKGSLTYNELDRFSNGIANKIKVLPGSKGRGNIGLLLDDPSDTLAVILGILKSGNVYVPLSGDFPPRRIAFIIDHAGINIFITDKKYRDLVVESIETSDTRILVMEEMGCVGEELAYLREVRGDVGASLLYTSGSTGVPKGVLQYHENILYYVGQYTENLGITWTDRLTLLASFTHDVTLLDMYAGLLNGAALFPLDLKKDGVFPTLPQWLKNEKITIWHSVPTVFRYFTSSLEGKPKPKPELPFLRRIVLGGESVLRTDIEKFNVFFANCPLCQLYTLYGQTESSYNSGKFYPLGSPVTGITLGKINNGIDMLVVDEQGSEVDALEVGEIVVSGRHLSPGYWKDEQKTREKFIDDPYGEAENSRVYFTGDLGHCLMNGEIEFLGRKDNQIKLRGYRVELEEIEKVVMQYSDVTEAAVIPVETSPQEKFIACYFSAVKDIELSVLRKFLEERLAEYMIPAYFRQLVKLPVLVSGKVNKKALPPPEVSPESEYVPPGTGMENRLVEIWSEVLGLGKEVIGINSNFFQLGGHSLKAASLTAKIHSVFKVKVPLAEVFERQTVKELAEYMENPRGDEFTGIVPIEKREYYPLSSAQKRLYFIQQMDLQATAYNMPNSFSLGAMGTREGIEHMYREMMRRYEILRTSVVVVDQEPVQRVHDYDSIDFSVDYLEIEPEKAGEVFKNFIAPFDLSLPPLFRVALLKAGDDNILIFDFHHILTDNTSMNLLERVQFTFAEGKPLPELARHYKDYCWWQQSKDQREAVEKQGEYWLKMLSGKLPVLELPYDYPRPGTQSSEGSIYSAILGKEETLVVKKIAKETDTTVFMVFTAIINLLFSKLSSQEDIIIGTPVSLRSHPDLQHMIGMLVNTLVLRNYPRGEKKFTGFLSEVKQHTLAAFENLEYPYESLIVHNKINFQRIPGRNPLFDVMFNLLDERRYMQDSSKLGQQDILFAAKKTSRFDLALIASDRGDNVHLRVEYSTRLFKAETIERMMGYLRKVSVSLPEILEKNLSLKEIEILSEKEKANILEMAHGQETAYGKDKTLHRLFEEQVERTPDRIAAVGRSSALTYRLLNKKSDGLAVVLKEKGVKPGIVVGMMLERSLEMIIGILGILKAGGAYLPMDTNYPEERINYMLADSNAGILITTRDISMVSSTLTSTCQDDPANLAYIIYTSGSTGKPKGVPICHSNVSPLLHWGYKHLDINPADRVIQNQAYHFDWSVWVIFITLTSGACLYMVPVEVLLNPENCIDFMVEKDITVFHVTPTQYRYIADVGRPLASLRYLFMGGEILSHDLALRCMESVNENCRVYNMYGSTEAAIISTALEIERAGDREYKYKALSGVPIGKPVGNTELLILDKYLSLCPVNMAGECYIAGGGLAPGYLNDPEKTCRAFVKNIYKVHGIKGRRLYKTGDMVRWLPGGNIEFSGRLDYQVKIRGLRIELGEIENRLLTHEEIKEAVVTTAGNKDQYLCAYIVPAGVKGKGVHRPSLRREKLKEYLSQLLPDYMIPSHFISIEKIPLTPNGKIDRKALPEPALSGEESHGYHAPRTAIERKLAELWSDVLGKEQHPKIGIHDNFFELGGHSLNAAVLTAKIHKELQVKIPLAELFRFSTIKGLSSYIEKACKDGYLSIEPVEKKDYYVLSSAQRRLYILQQMELNSTAYNIPEFIPLGEAPGMGALEEVFHLLIRRHESLRTSFEIAGGQPVQRVHDEVEFKVEVKVEVEEAARFIRPFDLSQSPLLRAGSIKTKDGNHMLMVDMHHIISDGVSHQVLVKDFSAFTRGEDRPPLRIQYKDFSEWQNSEEETENIKRQEAYWLGEFAGEIPVQDLPTDYERPPVQSFEGSKLGFSLDKETAAASIKLASQEKVTVYMLFLALYNVWLAKMCRQEDIVLGTPVAGRRHADLEQIIGMFVNTLALRNYPKREKSFREFLKDVKKRTLDAFENQDYPFEDLMEKVVEKRDMSRNPLFDMMFSFVEVEENQKQESGTNLDSKDMIDRSKFDMTLTVYKIGKEDFYFDIKYCTRLFKKESMKKFIHSFKTLVSMVIENPGKKISEILLVSESEKAKITANSSIDLEDE